MADDLTPGHVSGRRFDVVRKGYDRSQVEQFLASVDAELARLTDALEASTDGGVSLGIDEQEAIARELHTIGGQVGDILEAARAAAEGMRTRASDDADRWRSSAESESATLMSDAQEQSQSMRAAAWNEGSSLLSSAAAEAQSVVAAAKEEALFIRAEAEREAIRLTGDAKRDREEVIRSARQEADQIIESARQESDGVLAAASQQAELAQERARALEDRRSELLSELEATRASISELETEIESRRQELEEPEEPEPVVEAVDERSHHASDGGSVKIVASTRVAELKPVDAEELVAEVEALRAGESAEPHSVPPAEPPRTEQVSPLESTSPTPTPAPATTPSPPPVPVTQAPIVEPAQETVAAPSDTIDEGPSETPATGEPEIEEPESVQAADAPLAAAPEDDDHESTATMDELGSLFAQLRESSSAPDSDPDPAPGDDATESEEGRGSRDGAAAESSVPPDEPPAAEVPPVVATESADSEAATAIAFQNSALRTIKRTLVDLQNETLEHLRTDAEWSPDEDYTNRFEEPFGELTEALTGAPQPDLAAAFATDLYDAVSSAIDRARAGGGGDREIAAAASKVFRTWRSDEAERRVFAVAAAGVR